MTYFAFLLIFLVIPIALLAALQLRRRGSWTRGFWVALAIQIALALVYTTPWDNYLVATGVWYYNPGLVTGIVLGYVPIEEYTFFVLETLLVGLWWSLLSSRLKARQAAFRPSTMIRVGVTSAVALLWLVSVTVLVGGWRPGTYLSITLAWALPPIALQLAYGADILWHERRLVAAVILPLGLFLSTADALAIRTGIWAIDPAQTTGWFVGRLPVEEAVFFFITVILIAFGLTLTLSEESRKRLPHGSSGHKQVTIGG